MTRPRFTTDLLGMHRANGSTPERTNTDGYEGRFPKGHDDMSLYRERLARSLELDRLKASIHRCDESPVN